METETQSITLIDITREQGIELINEIRKLAGSDFVSFSEKHPNLKQLYKLLTANFESRKEGVHFVHNKIS